jgi:hypothetical protein
MPTTAEDVDALFDAPAQPSAVLPNQPMPGPAPESRRETRVKVNWAARLQLPDGRVIEVKLRDMAESGVGLLTDFHIPPAAVMNFAIAVPRLDEPTKITPVTGTIRTSHVVVQGRDLVCGGTWVSLPSDSRALLDEWIKRLRR